MNKILIIFIVLTGFCVGKLNAEEIDAKTKDQITPDLVFDLSLNPPPKTIMSLGKFHVHELTDGLIVFSQSAGDLRDQILYDRYENNFNFDGLYRVTFEDKSYYFRFGWQSFENGKTKFLYVNWANGIKPPKSGLMIFDLVAKDIEQHGSVEVSTIGDSITWWANGEKFRKKLSYYCNDLKFIGTRTDTFGFGHDGEGGDGTEKVLERLKYIKKSDYYLLLIGTNDRFKEDVTINNIKKISSEILKININSNVFIVSLLPRDDEFLNRNININKALKNFAYKTDNIHYIDIEKKILVVAGWKKFYTDKIHPSNYGYDFISQEVCKELNKYTMDKKKHVGENLAPPFN